MLTRGDPKVDGGRRTYSARHLVELVGSTRQSAQIYYELWTDVPLTLERFTRFTSDLDGYMRTTRGYVPIQSARSCDVGDGRSRYMRPKRLAASRGAEMSSYQTPYSYIIVGEMGWPSGSPLFCVPEIYLLIP